MGQVGRHIGLRRWPNRQVISGDSRRHRGKERICHRIVSAEPRAGCAGYSAGIGPDQFQPRQIGQDRRGRGALGVRQPQVHRAVAAQRRKAGVHLGGQRAGGGAGARVFRPMARARVAAGQFLGNGEAFGHHGAIAAQQRRGSAGRGEITQQKRQFIGVEPGGPDLYRNAKGIEQQPAAQRPAGIAAVADGECIGHQILQFHAG